MLLQPAARLRRNKRCWSAALVDVWSHLAKPDKLRHKVKSTDTDTGALPAQRNWIGSPKWRNHLNWDKVLITGAIHSTKIQTGPTGKRGPPQKVDLFFRSFSGWTEPIHWVLDRNFRKFWLNRSCPTASTGGRTSNQGLQDRVLTHGHPFNIPALILSTIVSPRSSSLDPAGRP